MRDVGEERITSGDGATVIGAPLPPEDVSVAAAGWGSADQLERSAGDAGWTRSRHASIDTAPASIAFRGTLTSYFSRKHFKKKG